jgi:PIN domain nuclease of toxin-antitoxin system
MAKLELQYLYEIDRITESEKVILDSLHDELGLRIQNIDFDQLINQSLRNSWTRDPFDRLIVSHAQMEDAILCTKDHSILNNYEKAAW